MKGSAYIIFAVLIAASSVSSQGQTPQSTPKPPTQQPAQQQGPTAAEIEAKNKQIEADNAAVVRSFTTGNDALNANKLDEAIAAYREGLRVRPEEPALLTNFAEALRRRGVNSWNEGLRGEAAAKDAKHTAAKKDWTEAAASSAKALQSLNQLSAEQQQQPAFLPTKTAAASTRAMVMRLVASKVDQTQAGAAWDANVEYVSLTSDSAEKSKLKGEGLQMLFDAGAFDLAILHSRAVLKEEPQNLDAHRVLGVSLFASDDKVKMQEALSHLQQYLDKAPDTDPQKETVRQAVEFIKAQKP
ncbi:MAG TPA: hypothetical protein VJU84_16320 [Pyrinomonadaceae bacterium]|nr:hypothetical protein [Pyrinomonadaceae bacterium]